MIKYVAFLRGINVGGQKLIKMANLARMFSELGLSNVKTFIQSGNILFESEEKNAGKLAKKIEKNLVAELGYPVMAVVRSNPEIESIIKLDPFKRARSHDSKKFVTFLSKDPILTPKLPLLTERKEMKILSIHGRDLFSIGLPLRSGWYAIPNIIIEKEFDVIGTTRNWTTVKKIYSILLNN